MTTLHHWYRGNRDAPVVVLVHGFMGDGRDFEDLIAPCAQARQFVLVDLPGHGESVDRLPDDRSADLGWMARQLADFIAGLPHSSLELVGYSMGGRIALYTALYFGNKIRDLSLVSASPGIGDPERRKRRRQVDARRASRIRSQSLEAFIDDWYQLPLFADLREHRRFAAMYRRRLQNDSHAIARVIEEMSPGAQPDLWPSLSKLSMPSRWIAGDRDSKYVDICRQGAEITHGELQIVEDAGHTVHLQSPQSIRSRWTSKT